MNGSKMLWRITGSAAVIATLLFIGGFIYAVRDIVASGPPDIEAASEPASAEPEPFPTGDVTILALGDSLTKGTGDLSGDGGYVGKAAEKLSGQWKKPAHTVNYAVNGWRTDDLLPFIGEPNVQRVIRQADIVMLTIGANDLNQAGNTDSGSDAASGTDSAAAAGGTGRSAIDYDEARNNLPAAEERLKTILTEIAALNPKAKIVYVGLYNPFIDDDPKGEGSAIVQDWNLNAARIANGLPQMAVVPTYDLFQFGIGRYLYIDAFHPNSQGYERMADRVVQALQ